MDGNVDALGPWVMSGADINQKNAFGLTPLMYAASYFRNECVAAMLRLGASARHVDNRGRTALHWLAARVAEGTGDGLDRGSKVVQLLVQAGCDDRRTDETGRTAVDLAALNHGAEWKKLVEGWVAAAKLCDFDPKPHGI